MTSFDACFNRLYFQLKKATKFFTFTFKTIKATGDEDIIQLFNEFFIIKIFCMYEEFMKSIILQGGIRKQREVIDYFNSKDKEKKHQINDLNGLVIKLRTVGFHNDQCRKLKILFRFIFGFDFFPDSKTEKLFLDLILLRNIIVHAGGSIEGKQVEKLYFKDVVEKTSNLPKPLDFYRLRIHKSKFDIEITKALRDLIIHIQSNLKQMEN